nr:hypothetical protein [Hyphomicrobium sp.]
MQPFCTERSEHERFLIAAGLPKHFSPRKGSFQLEQQVSQRIVFGCVPLDRPAIHRNDRLIAPEGCSDLGPRRP